ncbi:MAG: hypothetical protein KAS71_04830, partial [Bacteroidales bacterium]|nr:hypothetical protein [Bacteroidales bacterium]
MKNNRYFFLTHIILLAIFSSCEKDDFSEQINIENRLFENYLLANNITTEPTASGLYYIEEEEGTGATPIYDNWVIL